MSLSYCHNVGNVSGNPGGIISDNNNTYTGTSVFWLSTCGANYGRRSESSNVGAEKLTLEEMKTESKFTGWDFDTVWKMDATKGYPVLQWSSQ